MNKIIKIILAIFIVSCILCCIGINTTIQNNNKHEEGTNMISEKITPMPTINNTLNMKIFYQDELINYNRGPIIVILDVDHIYLSESINSAIETIQSENYRWWTCCISDKYSKVIEKTDYKVTSQFNDGSGTWTLEFLENNSVIKSYGNDLGNYSLYYDVTNKISQEKKNILLSNP